MAMYLTNGTLNYNLTKEYILTPEQIAERNNMIPDYPDPNDERFKETLPVFTLENNQLCRDGVAIGKIYNNKTGKVVEITETTETGFKYQDTNEDALINKDNSVTVVEKLTGLKGILNIQPKAFVLQKKGDDEFTTNILLCDENDQYNIRPIMNANNIDANGHTYYDLNLSSSTLWSNNNIGDDSFIGIGTFFPYSENIVQQQYGGSWCLPTKEQFEELVNADTAIWADTYGPSVPGVILGESYSNFIFLPANAKSNPNLSKNDMCIYWIQP